MIKLSLFTTRNFPAYERRKLHKEDIRFFYLCMYQHVQHADVKLAHEFLRNDKKWYTCS